MSQTDKLMELLKTKEKIRVFTFGIGFAVSHAVINGIARAGYGASEFCIPGDAIEPKLDRHVSRILHSSESKSLDWKFVRSDMTVPPLLPPVINDHVVFGFALMNEDEYKTGGQVILGNTSSVSIPPNSSTSKGKMIHRLAAKWLIKQFEGTGDSSESLVVPLATKYCIASKFTSFVAVEDREEKIEKTAELVKVPSAKPKLESDSKKAKEGKKVMRSGSGESMHLEKESVSDKKMASMDLCATPMSRSSSASESKKSKRKVSSKKEAEKMASMDCDEECDDYDTSSRTPTIGEMNSLSDLWKKLLKDAGVTDSDWNNTQFRYFVANCVNKYFKKTEDGSAYDLTGLADKQLSKLVNYLKDCIDTYRKSK